MKPLIYTVYLLILTAFLASCSDEVSLDGKTVNSYADPGHSNSFENYNQIHNASYYVETPENADKTAFSVPPLILGSSKFILAGYNGCIYKSSLKKVEWKHKLDSSHIVATHMVADKQHNIYAITNQSMLISLDIKGKLRWKIQFQPTDKFTTYSNPLALDDAIIIAMSDGQMKKISLDGKIIWEKDFKMEISKEITADKDNNLAFCLTHNLFSRTDTLVFMDKNANILWKQQFDGHRFTSYPVIKNDIIYAFSIIKASEHSTNKLSTVFAFDKKGSLVWKKEIANHIRSIAVANDNRVYFSAYIAGIASNFSSIFCLDDEGQLLWDKHYEFTINSKLLLSKNFVSFLAQRKTSTAQLFLSKDGVPSGSVSLADAPVHRSELHIVPGAFSMLAASDDFKLIRVDELFFYKILPF